MNMENPYELPSRLLSILLLCVDWQARIAQTNREVKSCCQKLPSAPSLCIHTRNELHLLS